MNEKLLSMDGRIVPKIPSSTEFDTESVIRTRTWYGKCSVRDMEQNSENLEKIKAPIPISKNRSKIDISLLFFLIGIPFQNAYQNGFFVPDSGPRSVPTKMRTKIRTTYRINLNLLPKSRSTYPSVTIRTEGTAIHACPFVHFRLFGKSSQLLKIPDF